MSLMYTVFSALVSTNRSQNQKYYPYLNCGASDPSLIFVRKLCAIRSPRKDDRGQHLQVPHIQKDKVKALER